MSGQGGGGYGGPPRGGPSTRSSGSRQLVHHRGPLTVTVNCLRVTQLPRKPYRHYDGEQSVTKWKLF